MRQWGQISLKGRSTDNRYGRRAGVLTVVSLLAKVVGALYRIPLTNIIGAAGVGLYQLIFSIYALSLAFTSAFSATLISKRVASCLAVGDDAGAKGYFVTATAESLLSSLLVGAVLFLFGGKIAEAQGAASGGVGYRVIAPAVVLVALLSALKGWFNGNMDLMPTSLSIMIEQGVKLSVGILLASLFRSRGVAVACAAALGGVTLSELAATLTVAVLYLIKREKGGFMKVPFRRVLKEGLPLRLNGLILPVSVFVDGLIIVRLLGRFGLTRGEAVAQYGIYSGAINSIVNFPVVLVISLAIAVIPLISAGKAKGEIGTIKGKASLTIKLALVISLPSALALILLAPHVVALLYPVFNVQEKAIASRLLAVGAGSVIFLSLTQIYSSLLQAIDRADVAAESLAIAMLVRVGLTIVLVPVMGILGIAVSTLLSYALATLLSLLKWLQYTGRSENALKTLATVTASGGIMVLAILAPVFLVGSPLWSLLLSAVIGSVVYVIAVLKLKVFTLGELRCMPLSSITTKIGR
ncbi:MAG TPA: hypothetical protein DIC18_04020 [Clostridiales bacterium]|nr:hypothetical protein [Clostridiales bacterium]HCU56479.1 hypothetical protein [Clostridiales bacterium]